MSLGFWLRLARGDRRLLMVYIAALAGAFIGAKLAYLAAEGWMDWGLPDQWQRWATGKSILGGLLVGYLAVEWAKKAFGYKGVTGDWFALVAPAGIILGRIGCWRQGCCPGRVCDEAWFTVKDGNGLDRWPAPVVEIVFNIAMLAMFWAMRQSAARSETKPAKYILEGQHFHIYLIAYGLFRFGHEFLRAEARVAGPFTGYQLIALVVLIFGLAAFQRRQRAVLTLTDTRK